MNIDEYCVTLENGIVMPQIGFGTWQLNNEQAERLVHTALEVGYRHIDTAAAYGNERGVGRALKQAAIPRDQLFITTKLHDMEGYDHTLQQFEASLIRLGLDYIDLYLIHWPFDEYTAETWRALEKLYDEKRVRAIGVSNFSVGRLQTLLKTARVRPMVNQIELHPYLSQSELRAFCERNSIQVESWSPLMQGKELLQDTVIAGIAQTHNKTAAQIILRWHVQHGLVALPKSTNPERIRQNIDIFDFALTAHEMHLIDNLNQNRHANPIADPDTFVFTKDIYDSLQRIND